ncbi:MAG: hypothetical protein Q7W45_00950 [Bacteroidota bacterium]|jgi:hypothetical protein|nr:hypothetical protein [Bacteroidota bacterium]MDP3146666.1 hypothetical protein [Bacteroidota bacterium]
MKSGGTVTVTKIAIRPYTNKDLARLFGKSESTWRREVARIRHQIVPTERIGHSWSIKQVEQIMSLLGRPYEVIEELG